MSAREQAVKELDERHRDLTPARATIIGARRIGWALLDVADAIREHAEATRAARRPTRRPRGRR